MPPSVFLSCLAISIFLELLFPWPIIVGNELTLFIIGIIILAMGITFMMWGHGRFRSLGVNVPTNMPVSRLVTDGAHKYSRNPMYIGLISIILGLGVAVDSVWILISVLPMTLYISYYVIPKEEAYLVRTFGEDYKKYRNNVRKWL
ncbi:methyltransferase family protein [Maridesulfovibrio frigidus]|uniref:methyltransferase family protein n=1 Tax=Maridesulfovibrio frigidus TaxID=340956 RepID=UPI00146F943F|nr:isoprenylcysteine carboxylmethyltransferase family protein [Maridesulfovibrio frigidus]